MAKDCSDMDYFDMFCEVSRALGNAVSRKRLLEIVVESARNGLDGKAACLFLKKPGQEYFTPTAQTGLSERYFHTSPMKAVGLMSALEEKGFLVFEDATTDPRLAHHEAKKAEGIVSMLTVPVRVCNVTRGVLSLYTDTRRNFTKRQIGFLSALADQGGIAIHTNGLLDRLRKNGMLFLELASNINSSLDIRAILGNLTENICDTLEMKGADIRLLDEKTDTLILVASHGLSSGFLAAKEGIDTETTSRALKGETVIVADTARDERIRFKQEMQKEGIRAMIVVPILARDHVIGVMRLYSSEFTRFPSEMLVYIEALAHQGGLAIQNASMYLKLKQEKAHLEEDIWSHRAWF